MLGIKREKRMGLVDFIKKQFIDVIEWTESEDGVLAWRYPFEDREIQNGATLVVRESQLALFVNEGKVADLFGPGTHRLTTQTLPLLTNLKNWDKLFESPFKSDVYFFSTRQQLDLRWGTQSACHPARQGFRSGAPAGVRQLLSETGRSPRVPHRDIGHPRGLHRGGPGWATARRVAATP